MTDRTMKASPLPNARIAGVFYLLVFVVGAIALAVSARIVVPGDAAATAANLEAHAPRFWLGFTFNLIVIACYLAVTALFYELFKPISRSLSLAAALFSLAGCVIQAASFLFYIAPWSILEGAPYLNVFNQEQLQASALMSFKFYALAYNLGLAFFGFYCFLIGCLVFRSNFLPKLIGLLMMFAGVGWLTFLYPPLATYLRPYNLLPGIVGEGSLTLWLTIAGVNLERWRELTAAPRES